MMFCHRVHFFASRETGKQFFAGKEHEVYFLTLEEAFALGRLAFAAAAHASFSPAARLFAGERVTP